MASKWADSIKDQYKAGGDLEKRKVSLLDYFLDGFKHFGNRSYLLTVNTSISRRFM
ncbi:hypothetical protein FC51_GL000003 [Lentilactobacillus parabuchneri DSM 5707 = NBRC 107865]|uniref:Uncharacterized protein n=1 Tax=Lentilactobacillus parabuchneri DSM 5707 = NBRC 107865 TaxID=1423784 RepID=A0A0R1Z8Z2_9LACO|nr:hypothetical protein FC51_GL000003 [Lentilactobacillus parabuchneri DSM 5707 = NBRC 107865]